MRYLITFSCYGARLHGDESGSVDRRHNFYGSRVLAPDPGRARADARRMREDPYVMDGDCRALVLGALEEVCSYRGWSLIAAHVRSNHVHAVVESAAPPERVLRDFKGYASRALSHRDGNGPDGGVGREHGSTRWLWRDQDVRDAVRYVLEEQGAPMAVFVGKVP